MLLLWVWVISEPRTGKTQTVRELGQWLAVTSVITWHMVRNFFKRQFRKIQMTFAPPRLSK